MFTVVGLMLSQGFEVKDLKVQHVMVLNTISTLFSSNI